MTPVLTEDAIRRLPEPIVAKLRSLIARIRRVLWWRGCWLTLAALVASLIAVMAIDAAFDLESKLWRCLLSAAGLGTVSVVAWRTLFQPLRRTLGLAQVARMVEIHHPEMHERISTAVELLGSTDAASLRGSDELLAEVVKSAVIDVGTVTPEKEYSSLPMLWPKRLGAAALAILAVILIGWPFQGGILLARAVLPLANIGSATSSDLRMITQNATVVEGAPITLLVAAKGKSAQRLELRRESAGSPDGPATSTPQIERMVVQPDAAGAQPGETVFALTLPRVSSSFRYAATSGRARSKEFFVEVLHRPDITNVSVRYTFPPYTGLAPKIDPDSLGDISAITGTSVEVTATLNHPAAAATLVYDQTENQGPDVSLVNEGSTQLARWSAELAPGMNYRWTLHPKGAGELLGKPTSGTLKALEDLPPAVVIDSPVDRELSLRPNEWLPIVYSAADDYSLSAVDVIVKLDGRGTRIIPMPLPEKDPDVAQTWRGTAAVDLSKLPLAGANELFITVRVTDSLPPSLNGPQTATSETILVRLNWGAESFARQTVNKQEEQLRRELEQLRTDLWDQQRQASEKARQLRDPEPMDSERLDQLEKLTARTAMSASQLKEIAQKAQQSAFAERADAIAETAKTHVEGAATSLQKIPQSDQPEERSASAENAQNQLEKAARELDEILASFQQDRQEGQELGELASLAREQQSLADQAAQAAPNPPAPKPAATDSEIAATSESTSPPTAPTPPSETAAPSAPNTIPPPPTVANEATTNPLIDPAATPEQRTEAFERWLQHQDDVEHRSQNVANQFQQKLPVDRQSDLADLATQARDLAGQAAALAARQDQLAQQAGDSTPAAPTEAAPPGPPPAAPAAAAIETAREQGAVATTAGQLADSLKKLQQDSASALKQNGKADVQAEAAASTLAAAATTGREASASLAKEAGVPLEPIPSGANPALATPSSLPSDPAASPPEARTSQQAVRQTGESLDAAATALSEMARALSSQAEGAAAASQALSAATTQTKQASDAGDAAQQAGREAAQQTLEKTQGSAEASMAAAAAARLQSLAATAATPAQQAATHLAMAAATAQAAMGVPENALGQQNMGKKGSPKPGDGQQGQGQTAAEDKNSSQKPGSEASDKAGLQTSQDYGLPPELAKLGMSPDDWSRLRGLITSGSDGTSEGSQVPAEYRELVKSYFRALSTRPPANTR
jgi:hypothetical protein